MSIQALSADAIHILRHIHELGTSPARDLTPGMREFSMLRALELDGLVESDEVGSGALVTITNAGRAALGVDADD